MSAPVSECSAAVTCGDAHAVRAILGHHLDVKATLDEPMPGGSFDQQALLIAAAHGSRDVVDALLDAGADINVRSRRWAGGFGLLDTADPVLVPHLIERGAAVDANTAAKLGMLEPDADASEPVRAVLDRYAPR